MKQINLGNAGLNASAVALGVMRIPSLDHSQAVNLLDSAHNAGVTFFDNADIYGDGESEKIFGAALKDASFSRDDVLVQTKVGIFPGKRYDFSKEHILEAVDASLERLQLDYVDTLLLHRPDPLMEPDDIAEAFLTLQNSGKVRQFGVSNFNPMQVEFLQQAVPQKLIANQLQLSIMHTGMIDFGMHTNMTDERSINHDGGILEYSRMHKMTIQAWSPFQYGFFAGVFIDNPKFPDLNKKLHELADKYNTNVNAIAAAWILRIPGTQVIAGTTNAGRIAQIAEAGNFELSKQEWYDVYFAAGNDLP
ncbi:aldo/keto reductase [Lacticaseibacillus sharpeae]|uniref:Aldo keto reductase n=1 Tax=Lacticaseibacillus sharpeae JCM 1186 = DSM 20505 TaxID=1291052 RepID=A0A0R1ZXV4_9LACO|nr:aldo/keto reductase [Lacticaseibacillus sharpeae]KRM55772.1 Aldo keto reductase [Lacticaseibacillus sharpeae JCM 1186 = DSM 20505]